MQKSEMRDEFKRLTSGLADDNSETIINGYLNNIYAEFLPADVGTKLHEVIWVKTLAIDTNPIVIPNHIVGFPKGLFHIQGTGGTRTGSVLDVTYYDTLSKFMLDNPNYADPSNRGRPCGVYRAGKELFLDKFPDAEYNLVAIDATGAKSDTVPDDLPFNHAMAVVSGAAWRFLLTEEDEVAVARVSTIYETYKTRLHREYGGDKRQRTPGRSF